MRDTGADIQEESVTPLSEEVSQLLDACDVCLKTAAGGIYKVISSSSSSGGSSSSGSNSSSGSGSSSK